MNMRWQTGSRFSTFGESKSQAREVPISVAIVEDHVDLRNSLGLILKTTPGYSCVGSYGSVEELLEDMDESVPQVILMDIGLPGMSGIEGVRRVKELKPETHIVMQTIYDDDERVFQAVCAGASGYLLKHSSPLEILQAIEQAVEGGVPMSPSIAQQVMTMFRTYAPQRDASIVLTSREQEILHSLSDGLDYKQIAERHFISIDTVRGHIRHIYEKLHVHSKSEAVAKAFRQRLV
jgi:DNA-binding NarL/FixJ family response regulator